MLAGELRLHDVRVLVLEKETEPASFVRIVALHVIALFYKGLTNRYMNLEAEGMKLNVRLSQRR